MFRVDCASHILYSIRYTGVAPVLQYFCFFTSLQYVTCIFCPDIPKATKKMAGTASMVRGSTAKCWNRRLTQLHSTPQNTHGRHRMIALSTRQTRACF